MLKVILFVLLTVGFLCMAYGVYLVGHTIWLDIKGPDSLRELEEKYRRAAHRRRSAKRLKEKLPENHPDHYRLDTIIDLAEQDMHEYDEQIARIKLLELEEDV